MKNKFINIKFGLISFMMLVLFPLVSHAAPKTLKDIAKTAVDYLNIGLELIIALAVVTFVWNIYKYYFTDAEKKDAGMYLLYSIIGFFLIISFWGIVNVVMNSVQLDNTRPNIVPFGGGNSGTGGNGSNAGGSGGRADTLTPAGGAGAGADTLTPAGGAGGGGYNCVEGGGGACGPDTPDPGTPEYGSIDCSIDFFAPNCQ